MRHVHRDCLLEWIKTAALERCDLCKHPFDVEFTLKPLKTKAASDRELLLALLLMFSPVLVYILLLLVAYVWCEFATLQKGGLSCAVCMMFNQRKDVGSLGIRNLLECY